MTDESANSLSPTLKPSVQRRLEFIDFRLLWSGGMTRQALCDSLQISPQQASADIAAYQDRAPQNMEYDHGRRAFVRLDSFQPLYMKDYTDRYLLQLMGIRSGWIRKEDTYFDSLPASEVVTLERRRTGWQELVAILDGIREGLEVKIAYNSISSPGKQGIRWIAPHAMVYSAGRWHIRAWSREHNDFRDFNLNRIERAGNHRPVNINTALDYEWHTTFDLKLYANPKLKQETKEAVEREFEMADGILIKNIRLSHIFYLMVEYLLNIEPGKLDPNQQQLLPLNLDEALAEQKLARKMAAEALQRALKERE
tara:strand:+ start:416 stop:1348 length:933 start_codon:yes stop_codon:yes gene_type:complete